jgi:hypothetical protein
MSPLVRAALRIILAVTLALATSPSFAISWGVALGDDGRPVLVVNPNIGTVSGGAAVKACEELTDNCRLLGHGRKMCFAIAKSGETWGVGEGYKKVLAAENALADCKQNGGASCRLSHEEC